LHSLLGICLHASASRRSHFFKSKNYFTTAAVFTMCMLTGRLMALVSVVFFAVLKVE
jgi:hypothetical protein